MFVGGMKWDRGYSGNGTFHLERTFSVVGGETGYGVTGAILFLLLAVLLIATSSLNPGPVWRSLTTVAVGLFVLAVTAGFLSSFDTWKKTSQYEIESRVQQANEQAVKSDSMGKSPQKGDLPGAAGPPQVTITAVVVEMRDGPFVALGAALALVILGAVQVRGGLRQRHPPAPAGA